MISGVIGRRCAIQCGVSDWQSLTSHDFQSWCASMVLFGVSAVDAVVVVGPIGWIGEKEVSLEQWFRVFLGGLQALR